MFAFKIFSLYLCYTWMTQCSMSWIVIAIIALVHTIFFLNNPICSWNLKAIFHLVKGDYNTECTTDISIFARCWHMTEILSHKGWLWGTVQCIFTKQLPWPVANLLRVIPNIVVSGCLIYLYQRQLKFSLPIVFSVVTVQKQAWLGIACVSLSMLQAKHLFISTYKLGIMHNIVQAKKKKKKRHNKQLCRCKNFKF